MKLFSWLEETLYLKTKSQFWKYIIKEKIAKIIREDYLQQDAFSNYDYNCPLYKTSGMMRCIITYFEDAKRV